MRRFVPILPAVAAVVLGACNAPAPESTAPVKEAAPVPAAAIPADEAASPVAQAGPVSAERAPGAGGRQGRGGQRGPQTLEAFQTRVARGFDGLDANGDGVVSAEELNGASGGRAGPMLSRLDENGDGQVTRAEMSAGAARMFKRMDANGDGVVTPDERPQFNRGGPREAASRP